MSDILELNGGAFLVKDRSKGDIGSNFMGWAYVNITNLQLIEIGYLESSCETLEKNPITLCKFVLNNPIPLEKLEYIGIMCNRGFNTTYAYNYSQSSTYIQYAKSFFMNL